MVMEMGLPFAFQSESTVGRQAAGFGSKRFGLTSPIPLGFARKRGVPKGFGRTESRQ